MAIVRAFVFVLCSLLVLHCALTSALPIKSSLGQQQPLGGEVTCDKIDKYSTEWFLRNTRPEHRRELKGTALFYTRGLTEKVRKLACNDMNLVSLWDIWPEWLYNSENTLNNRLRCIHADNEDVKKYYSYMSEAYARMARSEATIMHQVADYAQPPLTGIWGKIELPALQKQTDVISMKKISDDRKQSSIYSIPDKSARWAYERAMQEVRGFWAAANAEKNVDFRRSARRGSCVWRSPKEDAFFDSLV